MGYTTTVLCGCAVLWLVSLEAVAQWGPYRADYVRAFDGDTATVDLHLYPGLTKRTNIRIDGIDTPEMHGCEPDKAIAAREFTRAFLQAHEFTVIIHGIGKYGRPLAEVTSQGADLGSELISAGLARSYEEGWC